VSKLCALLALWLLLLAGPFLGARELRHEEGRRAWPAREGLRDQQWVVPQALGAPYLAKPPGFPWAVAQVALGLEALGLGPQSAREAPPRGGPVTPFALRVTGLLGLWLLACAAALAAHSHGAGPRLALFAGLLAGLAPEVLNKSRLGEIDGLFAGLCALGALAVHLGTRSAGRAAWWLLPGGLCLLAAALTKGPLALVFVLAPTLGLAAVEQSGRARRLVCSGLLLSVTLALLALWAWAVGERLNLPAAELERLWRGELLRPNPQTLGTYLADRGKLWSGLLLGALPGSLALLLWLEPAAARREWARPALRFALLASALPLLVLSLWPAVRVRYALPLVPWFALLGAYFFEALWEARPHSRLAERIWRALLGLLIAAALVAFSLLAWNLGQGQEWSVPRWWPASVALFAAVACRQGVVAWRRPGAAHLLVPVLCLALAVRQAELCLSEPKRLERSGLRAAAAAIDRALLQLAHPAETPLLVAAWSDFNLLFFVDQPLRFAGGPLLATPGGLLLGREAPKGATLLEVLAPEEAQGLRLWRLPG
jgi:4-amino-4-deoxy-L-arabinose transferase-like glycosyltransferase